MVKTKDEAYIGVRIPKAIKEIIQVFVLKGNHLNESNFVRDAIREKIRREAPHLLAGLFDEDTEAGRGDSAKTSPRPGGPNPEHQQGGSAE